MTSYGDPDLILQTISYELGFDYIVSEDLLVQLAAFYNDISTSRTLPRFNLCQGLSYTKSTSNNYQDTRGFELTFARLMDDGGTVSPIIPIWLAPPAISAARGFMTIAPSKKNGTKQRSIVTKTVRFRNLMPERISTCLPRKIGPTLFDHYVLGGFMLNLTLDWQAGYWTTWNPGGLPSVAYNVQAVDFFNTYLRLDKAISFGKFRTQLFVDITNALNTRRLWNTGDYNYLASLHLPTSDEYTNIPGDDKVGDYRKPDVEFQPMEHVTQLDPRGGKLRAWYYEDLSGGYFEWKDVEGTMRWVEVDRNKLDQALNDKAYIDMPNASTYWFLDPRKIYFGLRVSFDLGQ
jgi:hypothetical protein